MPSALLTHSVPRPLSSTAGPQATSIPAGTRVAGKAITASEALDRITIAPDVMERIGSLLTSGSSLVISDEGLGRETSHGTDFVVVLK